METQFRSIYVHFPFCETKCHYCDFYSLGVNRTKPEDPWTFKESLKKEAKLIMERVIDSPGDGQNPSPVETIFFGGGTPSMTPPESMEEALDPLLKRITLDSNIEWTMEANPSSVEKSKLEAYRRLGVNRISMGVQSLRDDHLQMLGRVHSRTKAFAALEAIFSAGIENVSVDLLCGVPGQTEKDLEVALQELTSFPITHLSCYLLTLPKHHRMFSKLPDDETQLAHLLFLDKWMTDNGFQHYEISNFCRPNKQARHNLNYWKGRSYLGLGPSAHAFDSGSGKRWKNFSSLHRYAASLENDELPIEWTEALTQEQKEIERWMLALRLDEGFPKEWLKSPFQKATVQKFLHEGLMEPHPYQASYYRLSARGFALSDQIITAMIR